MWPITVFRVVLWDAVSGSSADSWEISQRRFSLPSGNSQDCPGIKEATANGAVVRRFMVYFMLFLYHVVNIETHFSHPHPPYETGSHQNCFNIGRSPDMCLFLRRGLVTELTVLEEKRQRTSTWTVPILVAHADAPDLVERVSLTGATITVPRRGSLAHFGPPMSLL